MAEFPNRIIDYVINVPYATQEALVAFVARSTHEKLVIVSLQQQ